MDFAEQLGGSCQRSCSSSPFYCCTAARLLSGWDFTPTSDLENSAKLEQNFFSLVQPQGGFPSSMSNGLDVISEAAEQKSFESHSNEPSESDGNKRKMESFAPESLNDFKHVIYNLLVENHNDPRNSNFVQPCSIKENVGARMGFRFNARQNPEKRIPELYAQHVRKARLDWQDQNSVFIQDLYKYYLRACVELLSKYFEKKDKYTYLYDDHPLFVPGESLDDAEHRLKSMKTRARKKRKMEQEGKTSQTNC